MGQVLQKEDSREGQICDRFPEIHGFAKMELLSVNYSQKKIKLLWLFIYICNNQGHQIWLVLILLKYETVSKGYHELLRRSQG